MHVSFSVKAADGGIDGRTRASGRADPGAVDTDLGRRRGDRQFPGIQQSQAQQVALSSPHAHYGGDWLVLSYHGAV